MQCENNLISSKNASSIRFLSLFSGIEAASVAWEPLSWQCVAVAEKEPFPNAVLAHRYPKVPNLGDVTKITEQQIKQLGAIDLVVGGFPCQDLSVAGKRKGLTNADGTLTRSGLFFTGMQIFHWAKQHCGTRFLLIENVPGLFSSNKGRDFATVVEQMAGLADVPVPPHGWGTEGVAVGDNGLLEWCVLDAQWFGLAQRRKRVFALLDTGDWTNRPPILLEPKSLRGDSPPSREKGESIAHDIAPSLTSGGRGVERSGESRGQDPIIAVSQPYQVANTLTQRMHKGINTTLDEGQTPVVAHSLRADGFNASEDGTGRGTPLIPIAFSAKDYGNDASLDLCSTLRSQNSVKGNQNSSWSAAIAIPILEAGARTGISTDDIRAGIGIGNAGDPMFTLQSAHGHAVAFGQNLRDEVRLINGDGQIVDALNAEAGMKQQHYIAFDLRGREDGAMPEGQHDTANIRAASGGSSRSYIAGPMQVRRPIPTECERLQGFPDGFTLIPWRGKPARECPDGPRYKVLGNSMARNCMLWIGQRIQAALRQISHQQ